MRDFARVNITKYSDGIGSTEKQGFLLPAKVSRRKKSEVVASETLVYSYFYTAMLHMQTYLPHVLHFVLTKHFKAKTSKSLLALIITF